MKVKIQKSKKEITGDQNPSLNTMIFSVGITWH